MEKESILGYDSACYVNSGRFLCSEVLSVSDYLCTFANNKKSEQQRNRMKRILPLFMATGIMMLGAVACKEKKQSEPDIITTKYVPEKPQAPIRMSVDQRQTDIKWLGRQYVVKVQRTPVDSLPMVADETGQKYIDNKVTLTIMRSDSSVFFSKTFLKSSFSSYIDNDYQKRGVLENIVFHEVDDNELEFSVIVSHPDADDEYIPLEMNINGQGGIHIERGNLFDERDDDDFDDEDDD